jgi:hypothetical protein
VAAGVGAVVAGELDEIDLVQDRDRSGEVGEEDEARLQQRDEQQVAFRIVARDLGAQFLDPRLQFLGLEEDVADAGIGG